jgi:hypothetical protein
MHRLAAWVLLPDPIYHFGNPSKTGTAMVETLQLDFEAREHFVLTGDVPQLRALAPRALAARHRGRRWRVPPPRTAGARRYYRTR